MKPIAQSFFSLLIVALLCGFGTLAFSQKAETSFFAPDTPVLGNPDAKVTITVFSDFQCPSCRVASAVLQKVVPKFGDKVGMFYVHYPLDMAYHPRMRQQLHAQAGLAAVASMCAQEEGDFWGYYKSLFDNQSGLGETLLLDLAQERGWDQAAFKSCLDSESMKQRVKDDVQRGLSMNVDRTPTIYVNGQRVVDWHDEIQVEAIISQKIQETDS